LEGYGRLADPVAGKSYLRYSSKGWDFAEQPLDNRSRPLVAKNSCAIASPHKLVAPDAIFSIRCPGLPDEFAKLRWTVSDTGGGLKPRQLDLYWGEDDPLGPGKRLSKPKGFGGDMERATVTVLASVK
jgi:hypothetical protein